MAATATEQVIANGPRNLVLKYTIAGTTGDTTDGILVNVSDLDTSIGVNDLRLMSVQGLVAGFAMNIGWDATANVDLFHFPADEDVDQDFSKWGGIPSDAGAGATGDVLFTTSGYTAAATQGATIVLWFKKS